MNATLYSLTVATACFLPMQAAPFLPPAPCIFSHSLLSHYTGGKDFFYLSCTCYDGFPALIFSCFPSICSENYVLAF